MVDEERSLNFVRSEQQRLEQEVGALLSIIDALKCSNEHSAAETLCRLRATGNAPVYSPQSPSVQSLGGTGANGYRPVSAGSAGSAGKITESTFTWQDTSLASSVQHYEHLLQTIKLSSPDEIDEIIRRLRSGTDLPSVLAEDRAASLHQPISEPDVEGTPHIEAEFSLSNQGFFGLVKGSLPSTTGLGQAPASPSLFTTGPWTKVTDDVELIDHLLSMYFAWQHPLFEGFREDLFRKDMTAGRTKHCSELLVNAICATGALISDRHQAHRTGRAFYDEAIRLLNEVRVSSIPSIAALSLLSHVEESEGRLSSMWLYSGRSSRMALDVSLHLRSDKQRSENRTEEAETDQQARLHAFWGCFITDQLTGFTLGRLPHIPTNAITVDLPSISYARDEEDWAPAGVARPSMPGAKSSTFHALAALSKIINSTLRMFFAPTKPISGSLLLNEYNKYLHWYETLPAILTVGEEAPAHVLCLHMYYHAAVLLLFRPFLRAQFTESDIRPSHICRQSAEVISNMIDQHRRVYDLTGFCTFHVHCLLVACTIHIINLPASTQHLKTACEVFHGLCHKIRWAAASLNIIAGLVQKWNITLPYEVENALYSNGPVLPDFDFHEGAQAVTYLPEKKRADTPQDSTGGLKKRRLSDPEDRGRKVQRFELPTNDLFSPFPYQPPPLLRPTHTDSNADPNANYVRHNSLQELVGLDFSTDDWFDPFMDYQGS